MDEEPCFDIEIEDLDGWIEEDGWSDCELDDEMEKMIGELEKREAYERSESDRCDEENEDGWSDCELDDEMEKMIEELEEREVYERSESERCEEQNEDLPDMHVTCSPSSLRDYINSKRNKNTVRKTESIVNRFQ